MKLKKDYEEEPFFRIWINLLDTHPCNTEALEFYEEFKNQRMQALQEYAKYYGPLTLDTMCTPADKWKWIDTPWPWQEGGC